MPDFNGREALEIFRATGLDIPFIFVSRSLGEERAVEMMRAGAHDYIVKDHLTRLGASVARELRAAKLRREHRRLQDATAHLAALVTSSDDAILSKSLSGIVLTWNKGAEKIYGYSAAEIIGQSITKIIPADRIGEFNSAMIRIGCGRHVDRFDTVRRRKDGTLIDVSITISPILGPDGQVIGASTIARDVTERLREERERLRLIEELTHAVSQTKTLRSLLPICSGCKKIRDDHGYWQQLETYFEAHQHVDFSHSLCPDCMTRLYPEFAAQIGARKTRPATAPH
jgi:PAS domain S-box-containing protein